MTDRIGNNVIGRHELAVVTTRANNPVEYDIQKEDCGSHEGRTIHLGASFFEKAKTYSKEDIKSGHGVNEEVESHEEGENEIVCEAACSSMGSIYTHPCEEHGGIEHKLE